MVELTQETLEQITGRLVDEVKPVRIYLFGSRAYGEPRADSDIDLCVIVPDDQLGPRREVARRARQALRDFLVSVDVIVRRIGEFDDRATWPPTIEAMVKRKGHLLYG